MTPGFRGIDPSGLVGLAARLDVAAAAWTRRGAEAVSLLRSHGRSVPATGVAGNLWRVRQWAAADAGELRARAGMIQDAQRVAVSGAPPYAIAGIVAEGEFALVAPFGLADWSSARDRWVVGPEASALAELGPAAVAEVFTEISRYAVDRLVREAPHLIGSLDGAPADARYRANTLVIAATIADLDARAAGLRDELAQLDESIIDILGGVDPWVVTPRERLEHDLDEAERRAEIFRSWLGDGQQILLFDPIGDGRVAQVFGDLDTARHVAVVVPGITNDIENFGPHDGHGFRDGARNLYDAAAVLDGEVATIAWLGYDTPDGADAVLREAAEDGHGHLSAFIEGLLAEGDRHVTVIGHSYGSLVSGMAAEDGLDADELVFVGSPGTGLDHASEAHLAPGGDVWAALARWDPIGAGVDLTPHDPVDWVIGVPGRHLRDLVTGGELTATHLWHGRNPVHDSFGAFQITTGGSAGHSQYFEPGSATLTNLARIVAGLEPHVDLVGDEEWAPLPAGGGGSSW